MKYQIYKEQKDVKLLYFFAIVVSFALFLITYVIFQPTKEILWKDYATTEYDATIITESDGTQKLAVDISTPEQLAGIFTEEEKIYNVYQSSNAANQSKAYLATNVSECKLKAYLSNAYSDHKDISILSKKTYRLTNNISLSGKTWTPSQISLMETFDGMGHWITGITINNASENIGFVQVNKGAIVNLTVSVRISSTRICSSSSTRGYMGGICGKNYGIIKNCDVYGTLNGFTVQNNAEACVGGIAGICYGSTEPTSGSSSLSYIGLIQSCYNNATVTNGKFVGGIAGAVNWNSTIKLCYNQGTVTSAIENCDITVGGIVGQIANSTLRQCVNYSNVSASHQSGEIWVGGIAGKNKSSLEQCFNMGDITSDCSNYDIYNYAGGITGYSTATITESCNNGEVKALSKTITTEQKDTDNRTLYEGSMLTLYKKGAIEKRYIGQKVEQKAKAGGIAGYCENQISYCYNTAKVTSKDSYFKNYFSVDASLNRTIGMRAISPLMINNYYYGIQANTNYLYTTIDERYTETDRYRFEYQIVYNYASNPICPNLNFNYCYSTYLSSHTGSYIKTTDTYSYLNSAKIRYIDNNGKMYTSTSTAIYNKLNCSNVVDSREFPFEINADFIQLKGNLTFMPKSKEICYLEDIAKNPRYPDPEYITGLTLEIKKGQQGYMFLYTTVSMHNGNESAYSENFAINRSVLSYTTDWGVSQSLALIYAGLTSSSDRFNGKPYPKWLFWETSQETVTLS